MIDNLYATTKFIEDFPFFPHLLFFRIFQSLCVKYVYICMFCWLHVVVIIHKFWSDHCSAHHYFHSPIILISIHKKKRRLLSLYSIWLSLKIVVQELLNHNNSFERKKRLTSPKIKCIFLLSPFYLFVCVGIWLLPTTTNRKSIVFFAISNLQKILREGMYHFTIVMSLELLKCWNVLFDFCI